jgi:hypothetical protein
MHISRLETLVFALASLNGWQSPQSEAFQLRNPLLLKAFAPKHDRNERGIRRFPSFAAGMDNSIIDVQIKCSGKSFSKLTPDNSLVDLVCVYGHTPAAARAVKNFLRAALGDENIMESQKLGWFLESDTKATQAA